MLIPLEYLVEKYNIKFSKILHVGAHECEEMNSYRKYVQDGDILWVEAIPSKAEKCKELYPDTNIINAIVSDCSMNIKFNIANNGQSSSILEFDLHETFHPHIKYVDSFVGHTVRLESILRDFFSPNFVNLDIQGVELRALKGMGNLLDSVQYIYTEVNCDSVYKNCDRIEDIDAYLEGFGFKRFETKWCGEYKWGDAFYIKNI